ncbi:MAG: hypothetical protein A2511_12595 [Deltaproteobacteria bacterium RIFOXYD12_FULL_50_9]|nr:MAG: hypothetical protein A2511_12595 [Deltaproteobacteria bacterium RIFOXYD12_FULL_50_9]
MLLEQYNVFLARDTGIERERLREVEQAAEAPHAVIISGLRRAGKSTLLAQMARKLGSARYYYINFEDDRFLGFQADNTTYLYQLLVELFGERKIFVVDEIQNIAEWERFVRRFMDMGFKFYITGSNASLLSKELGSRLTGRYVAIDLFPFSFKEFLNFQNEPSFDLNRMTTAETGRLEKNLLAYLHDGGVPDALKYPKLPLLRTLYDDILHRDIVTRYHIDTVSVIKELAFFLMSNPAGLISFNKIKEQLKVGSVNTIKNYIGYMESSWLLFTLNVYDYSVKRQQIAPKKVYGIDPGMNNTIGLAFSPNTGRLLENAVFLALRRQTRDIYYYTTPNGYEVDFYLPAQRRLIQVTQDFRNPATRKREIRTLLDALQGLHATSALVLSDANEQPLEVNGVSIEVRSTAEWLLRQ